MRISSFEILRADGGWRPLSFLKVATDEGLVGWSEFAENDWSPGLAAVIDAMMPHALGRDPRSFSLLTAELQAVSLFTAGGLIQQAIAAIENACVDITAKAAGVPACALFGGPLRTSIDLYWSHCGSFRTTHAQFFEEVLGRAPLRSLEDVEALGREAAASQYRCVKINPIDFSDVRPRLMNPGFRLPGLDLSRSASEPTLRSIRAQVAAMRSGLGGDTGLMLDVNFAFRPQSLRRLVNELADAGLTWLEADVHAPAALAEVRRAADMPIASLETLYGRRAYAPFLAAMAADVAIVDVPWNGFAESVRIANLAEIHEVNVAPHNFYGPLADLMSAHYCAAVGNVAIMEYEADDVPWKYDLLSRAPVIEDGFFVLPTEPGWGADIDEEKLAAHPWRPAG
ncbi:MAG: mandelate racemase/muconate lactonizing enzyme family protein [Gammaproteobacteria bacterium]|jgi:L-alanine-DL-glutamate epimerase-like enolase superfamily enzyme